jgi:predicted ester cyclase
MPEPLDVARRFYEDVFGQGRVDVLDEILAEDFVQHEGNGVGKESIANWTKKIRTVLPDMEVEILAIKADGAEVWVHSVFSGTHSEAYLGAAPTGRRVSVTMIDRLRFRDGKAVEHWGATDMYSFMDQLGVLPADA